MYGQVKVDLSNTKHLSQLFYAWREQVRPGGYASSGRRKQLATLGSTSYACVS